MSDPTGEFFAELPSGTRSEGESTCLWEPVEPGRGESLAELSLDDGTGAAFFAEDGRPFGSGVVGISTTTAAGTHRPHRFQCRAREEEGRRTGSRAGSQGFSCPDDSGHPARAKKR
jgi:hypothetical protein